MSKMRRFLMIGAAAVAVGIQGCGCDSKKKHSSSTGTPPPESTVTIQGKAAKGVLQNFSATAHLLNGDGVSEGDPIALGSTGLDGGYSLDIPRRHVGSPIVIKVSPTEGSSMICDLPQGCGDADFGEPTPVDHNFQLSAIVPSVEDDQNVNISAFTDIAASLALSKLQESESTSLEDIRRHIAESNSQVANRFGISSDITRLPVLDLTKPSAPSARDLLLDSQTARYNALNAGLLSAIQDDKPESTPLGGALRDFIDSYVEKGVAANTSDDSETSMSEIINRAADALNRVASLLPDSSGVDLTSTTQNLRTEGQLLELEEPDVYSQGTASQSSNLSALEKVKAMVGDLRNLVFSFGEQTIEDGTIGAIADDFALQIEGAEMASSADAAALIEALALAATALDDANRAYQANNALTSYASDTGITVAITAADDSVSFTIDDAVQVDNASVDVSLSATNALELQDGAADDLAVGQYTVSGSAETADLKLSITNGSVEVDYEGEQADLAETHVLSTLHLLLQAELKQQDVDLPVVLSGRLEATVNNVELQSTAERSGDTTELALDDLAFSFSGNIHNSAGEAAQFALSLSGDAKGMSLTETWVNGTNTIVAETEQQYVKANGSLFFTAKLTGIPSAVVVNFSASRTGLDAADTSLTIRYPGKQFRASLAVEDGEPKGTLMITNQDNVSARMSETTGGNGKKQLSGGLYLDNILYGEITSGTVRYSDQTVETLY